MNNNDTVTLPRILVEQALEALEHAEKDSADFQRINTDQTGTAIDALRAALEQPQVEQEPFCYVNVNKQGDVTSVIKRKDSWRKTPLYLHPQLSQHTAVTECVAAIRART